MTVSPTLNYRADIDGLRALAVLPVILFHAGFGFPGGYVGVDVFFVISGYLITSLILREIDNGTFTLARFWERRIRRILPPLLTVMATSAVLGWFLLLPTDFKDLWGSIAFQSAMIANIWFWLKSGYFAAPAETQPLLHLWSLAVEEQFYVGLPVVLILLRRRTRFALAGVLGTVALISFGLCVYASYQQPDANYYMLPTRAWELLVGALLVLLPAQTTERRWVSEMVAVVGLGLLAIAIFGFDKTTRFPGVSALLPCLGAAAVIWTGCRSSQTEDRPLITRLLSIPILRGIGLISYSLYLWHWPLLVFSKLANYQELTWIQRSLVLAVSFLLAGATWFFIETPFRLRLWLPQRRLIFGMAGLSALVGLPLGIYLLHADGLPGRFSPETIHYASAVHDNHVYFQVQVDDVRQDRLVEIGGGPSTAPVHCLVWGDSHAVSIFPALKSVADQTGKRCVSATYPSTAPLLEFTSWGPHSLNEQCPAFNSEVVKYAARHRVPHVMLVGYWSCYGLNVLDPETGKSRMHPYLANTVRRLQESGARVWIMKQVPAYSSVSIPHALAHLSLLGRTGDVLRMPVRRHLEALALENATIDSMRDMGATILDPTSYMSDETDRTLVEADGQVLYRDSHHLTVAGAMRLRPLFEVIFAGPSGPDTSRAGIDTRPL